MNFRILIIVTSSILLLSFVGCGDKINRPDSILTDDQKAERNAQFDAPAVPNAPVTGGGVMHYTCPNGHAGSSAQGMCASCGATLVHNQAFHNQAPNPTNAPAGEEPPQNAAGIWHYTCPNGHAGGSGSATPCPECGATLVHNTIYHDQPGAADASDIIPVENVGGVPPPPPPPTVPEPAQNAAGVWHYTCPNGHDGGEGSAVPCAQCGTMLVHNTAYHN